MSVCLVHGNVKSINLGLRRCSSLFGFTDCPSRLVLSICHSLGQVSYFRVTDRPSQFVVII
jgi:hypothetical protein